MARSYEEIRECNRASHRRCYKANPEKRKRDNARRRAERWERFQEYKKGLCCELCGESHSACIEFHHLDPSLKLARLSTVAPSWGWPKLMAEISKCQILCANCHRKIHNGNGQKRLLIEGYRAMAKENKSLFC